MSISKKVYMKVFGCQMNVRDSEVIVGMLSKQGYGIAPDESEADVLIYNTCSVRQHAEDKVWSELGRIAKMSPFDLVHKARQIKTGETPRPMKKIVGLVGCMAQNYKYEVFQRAPNVDFIVGPSDIAKIPQILDKLIGSKDNTTASHLFERKILETDGNIRPEGIYHTGFYENKEHAYIVISEGCANLCSYCVVPYVRGSLKNRDYQNIIKEIEEVTDKGITNITLLGQNVNAYQYNGINFVKLLEMVNQIPGLTQFSFITSHPKDTSIDLFKVMRDSAKIKKYLHLPVQSGSDRILKLMNREYTRKAYLDLIKNYRNVVNGGMLTTDIIVGFPGETEEEFKDTHRLVKDIEFDSAYIFKYSPRPHTQAESLADDVPRQEKETRHQLILNLQKDISKQKRIK
jgi:tRNA-2-methylthio-N6-dimethylallyladenosine synthase